MTNSRPGRKRPGRSLIDFEGSFSLKSWPSPDQWQQMLGEHAKPLIEAVYEEIPGWIKAGRPCAPELGKAGRPRKQKSNVVVFQPSAKSDWLKISRKEKDEMIERLLDEGHDITEITRRVG